VPHCPSGRYSEDTHFLPRLERMRKLPSREAHRLITIPAEPPRLWSENLRQPLIQIDKIPKLVCMTSRKQYAKTKENFDL